MSSFQLPPLGDHNCWGPPPVVSGESVLSIVSAPASETLQDLPYHPFNKADKLFRISDWTAPVRDDRFKRDALGLGEEDPEADEGGAFSLVDNRPKLKPRYGNKFTGNKKTAPSYNNNNRSIRGPRLGRGGAAGRNGQRRPMRRWAYAQADRERALREASVQIAEEWKHVQDLDMIQLGNYVADVDDGEDIEFAGSLQSFNPVFNRVTPRQPSTLNKFENRRHFTASTSEDSILLEMIQNKQGQVFATDSILSCLMAAPRSVTPWDIIVQKQGDILIFDKRPLSRIDYVPVNETWTEQFASDKESVNHPDQLSIEATFINHSFSQQILSSTAPSHNFDRSNPFLDALDKGQEAAHVAFRYRKWELPGGVELVARCSLNGFTEKKDSEGEKSFFLARALNEADSKLQGSVDWRQKLESQTGAVLASEMRNNGYKLARWTAESVLSGADDVKLGFVSRVNPKNNNKHAILMTKQYSPQTFADSVNVKVKNLWGTLSTLISHLKKLDDGHYLLSRDPNKTQLHIHAIPANAFEHELDMDGEEGFDEQQ